MLVRARCGACGRDVGWVTADRPPPKGWDTEARARHICPDSKVLARLRRGEIPNEDGSFGPPEEPQETPPAGRPPEIPAKAAGAGNPQPGRHPGAVVPSLGGVRRAVARLAADEERVHRIFQWPSRQATAQVVSTEPDADSEVDT